MATLLTSIGAEDPIEYPVLGNELTIGRHKNNNILLDHLAVSSYHARVSCKPDGVWLEDLGSTNGTFVNKKRIDLHKLQEGDVILIGIYQLRFMEKKPKDAASAAVTKNHLPFYTKICIDKAHLETKTIDNEAMCRLIQRAHRAVGLAVERDKTSGPCPKAQLRILNGTNKNQLIMLAEEITILGIADACTVLITRTSRDFFAAMLELGSTSEACMIGERPLGSAPHVLKNHDIIKMKMISVEFSSIYGVDMFWPTPGSD